ncbi:MAG: HAD family hydrolase [Paludibacteraceae bacterium]
MTKFQDITTIIFDLGGVIIDLDWNECIRNFKKVGINDMENLVSTTLQRGFIYEYELGKISDEEFRNEIRMHATREVTDEQIDYAWTSLLVKISSEKLEMLHRLKKKYKILMLSNTNNLSYSHSLEMFKKNGHNVDDYFDKCYLSYKMHLAKPTQEIFEAVLKDAELKPEECYFLDDGIHNIETARNIGFNVELINPTESMDKWQLLKYINI